MITPDVLSDEADRLRALAELDAFNANHNPTLTGLVEAAASVCGVSISLISLVDDDRQWFKANVGLEATTETPREVAFCAHTIEGEDILEVPDAMLDPRFCANPMVTGEPGIRFYAGAPLRLSDGYRVGSLCVIGRTPARLNQKQRELLRHLAAAAVQVLESTRLANALSASEAGYRAMCDGSPLGVFATDATGLCTYTNARWQATTGLSAAEAYGHGWCESVHPDDREHVLLEWQRCAESGIVFDLHFRVLHCCGKLSYVRSLSRPVVDRDGTVTSHVGSVEDLSELRIKQRALKKSEQLLKETGAMAQVGGWELDLLTDSLKWTEQTCLIHGVSPDHEPTLQEAFGFYAAESRPVMRAVVARAVEFGESWDVELVLKQVSGSRIWVRAVGRTEFEGGRAVRLVGTFQNVDRDVRQRRELAEQRELLQVTLQSIGDAVITTDASGCISWLNPVAEQLTGWLVGAAMGKPLSQVYRTLYEQTRELADCPAKACLADGQVMCSGDRTILVSRSGDEFGVQESAAPIKSAEGRTLGAVLIFHDVTEQRRLSSDMTYRATHDSLTGLLNRAEFEACLCRTLERTSQGESRNALLYIDLDQFKLVNDSCGHSVGDELLQQIARLLKKAVRADDMLARLGGDEFGIILVDCSPSQAQKMARRICKQMDEFRFVSEGKRFQVGTSIGLVPLDDRWLSSDLALQAADSSCYAAKEAGRNRVHVWFDSDKAMRDREDDMHWASRLAQAIDENRFVLYAQRIEPLSSQGCGVHAEVLIRLQTPGGELIQPGAFLPAAERFHLATRMDRWVLQQAINVMVNLPDVSLVERLCINLSGQSVGDSVFHQDAIEMLSAAGPSICERLCLEITETAAVTNIADATNFIDQLHDLGVLIALDDFGAGSSSFGYLKSLKVDVLKIDGQFIEGLINDSLDEAAVRCFVDVAGVLNIKTVAEFVDLPELHERVREVGIDYAQGYIVHQPEPIANVLEPSDELSSSRQQARICGVA